MDQYIIAVAFDGCICKNAFPNIGEPNFEVIDDLKRCQQEGTAVILWTCREDQYLKDAVDFCEVYGLVFDAVNDNLPEINEAFGTNSRKVFANEYWDDRAVTKEFKQPEEVLL